MGEKTVVFNVILNQYDQWPETELSRLIDLSFDEEPHIRRAAAGFEKRPNLPEIEITRLMELAFDTNIRVQCSAVWALGRQTNLPEAAALSLIDLCSDEDALVRMTARNCIEKAAQSCDPTIAKLIATSLETISQKAWSQLRR